MTSVSRTELARGLWGAALVLAPGPVLRHVHGVGEGGPGVAVLRVLGARHLLQAAAVTVRPTPRMLLLGAAVDLSHCLSAVPLALAGGRYARAGAVETTVAAAWTAAEAARRRSAVHGSRA